MTSQRVAPLFGERNRPSRTSVGRTRAPSAAAGPSVGALTPSGGLDGEISVRRHDFLSMAFAGRDVARFLGSQPAVGDIEVNAGDIEVNAGDIEVNVGDIEVNAGDIEVNVGDIEVNVGDIEVNVGDIDVNGGDIEVRRGGRTAGGRLVG
ncbi:MAG: hypothetical protein R3A52_28675 [Polyangiales bacterium]